MTALDSKATTTAVNLKAPLASPSFTGDVLIMETAVPGQIKHAFRQSGLSEIRTELQVSGDISSNGTVWSQNEACLTGVQAYTKTEVISALALKAPLASPALTGTATAVNLTVSGTLLAGTTNVLTTLNSKANTSDVYTRTQIENALQQKIDSFVAPLKYTENLLTGINSLSIDPTASLAIGNVAAASAQITNNCTIGGTCNITGALTTTAFYAHKPYVALYVQANVIQTSTNVGFLAPSAFTMTHATNGLYSITFTPPHPNGNFYQIFATPRTSGSGQPFFVCTAKVEVDSTAGTKFTVWCRNASNAIIDGDFYVHTVP
jgi:hypothetical protein